MLSEVEKKFQLSVAEESSCVSMDASTTFENGDCEDDPYPKDETADDDVVTP